MFILKQAKNNNLIYLVNKLNAKVQQPPNS